MIAYVLEEADLILYEFPDCKSVREVVASFIKIRSNDVKTHPLDRRFRRWTDRIWQMVKDREEPIVMQRTRSAAELEKP